MAGAGPRHGQLPLDLGHPQGASRDDLVVSAANRLAVDLIDKWPAWPSPVALLVGPPGAGKSHLASIWRAEADALALPRAGLEGEVVARPILVEDIDAGAIDENGLFHLINAVREAGQTLLLTARTLPASWSLRLPDLASRLKAAQTVIIDEPDDHLLAGVVTKLFADRQVEVEPHVVQFLVRRMERSLSFAQALVAELDREAMRQTSRITRVLAGSVVERLERGDPSATMTGP